MMIFLQELQFQLSIRNIVYSNLYFHIIEIHLFHYYNGLKIISQYLYCTYMYVVLVGYFELFVWILISCCNM